MKTLKHFLMAALLLAVAVACGPKAPKAPKILVLYYSQTETTKTVAEAISTRLGADIEAIAPVTPYNGTYQETIERGRKELQEQSFPAIQPLTAAISAYDVIFLGYPIWFGTYANPIATLLDEVDFSGKKIVPFCTFGSGGLEASVRNLTAKLPESTILPGYGVRSARIEAMPDEIDRFLKVGGFLAGTVEPLADFPDARPVSEAEAAICDAAVGDYPMIHATAAFVADRAIPGGTEYCFTAVDLPREGMPQREPQEFKIYVTALDGQTPVFTRVVR